MIPFDDSKRLDRQDAARRRGQIGISSLHSQSECCCCGKEMKDALNADWLMLGRGEQGDIHVVMNPRDSKQLGSFADGVPDLWLAPIGSDCLRKHPEYRPYVIGGKP